VPNQLMSAFALALLRPQIPPFFLGARDRDFGFLRVTDIYTCGIFVLLCCGTNLKKVLLWYEVWFLS